MARQNKERTPSERGRPTTIADAEGLGVLIDQAVEARYGGSLKAAADEIGLDPALLWRLRHGRRASISLSTEAKLDRLIAPLPKEPATARAMNEHRRRWSMLRSVLMPRGTFELLVRYESWLQRTVTALLTGGVNDREYEDFRQRVVETFPGEARELDWAEAVSPLRGRIAWLRALGPLLDSERSGFVERSWREAKPADWKKGGWLYAFVWHGLHRELLLLRDRNPMQRAREAASSRAPAVPLPVRRRRRQERA